MAKAQNTGREGESAVDAFDMDVDETATPKQYFLDSEILCEDAERARLYLGQCQNQHTGPAS